MRFVPWLTLTLVAIAAFLTFAPNLLLHFILDLVISYSLIVTVASGLAAIAATTSVVRARNADSRRIVSLAVLSVSILLLAVTVQREWLSLARIDFDFTADGVRLSGTLYKPLGSGPFPAVVMAHGSPPLPRRLYAVWADQLTRAGYAVLIFDKRGTGLSQGSYDVENNAARAVLERHGKDLAAAIDALADDTRINPLRISIVGISQAGWTVPAALSHTKHLRSFVLISGPVASTAEESAYSNSTGELAGSDWVRRRAKADAAVARTLPTGFDPVPLLRASKVRGHWIFGTRDASIPVTRSLQNLNGLVREGQPYSFEVLNDADHLLLNWQSGVPDFDKRMWSSLKRELDNAAIGSSPH